MGIAWGSLFIVCVVSLAVGVAIVVLVAFALVGLSARAARPCRRAATTALRPSARRRHRDRGRVPARGGGHRRLRPLDHHRLTGRDERQRLSVQSTHRTPGSVAACRARPWTSGTVRAMTEVAPARFGAVEAGGTKFVCLLGSSPDDIVARTRIPTGADPAGDAGRGRRVLRGSPRAGGRGHRVVRSRRAAAGPPALRPHHLHAQARLARRRPRRPDPARRWGSRSASTPTSRAPRSARAAGARRRGCPPSST